jgi:tetratricopeptide (TPR) repeat protein
MQTLPERFRELRKRRGLTSTALARPRYSVSYVSQIERGQRRPSQEALRFFAKRLGVSPTYLESGVPDDLAVQLRYELEQARQDIEEDRAEEAARRARQVIEESERYGIPDLEGAALVVLGEALYQMGEFDDAITAFEKARATDLARSDTIRVVSGLARANRGAGNLKTSLDLIESFLEADHDPPLESGVVTELQTILVTVYFERGDVHLAERAAERALGAIDEDVSLRTQAIARWNISRVMAERERWQEALDLATRARVLLERAHNRRDVAKVHTAYAFLCLEVVPPKTEEAGAHLDQAEAILAEIGGPTELAYVRTERGRLAFLAGRHAEAVEHADSAIAMAGAHDFERGRAMFLRGRALAELRRHDDATSAFRDALALFESHEARQQASSCWRELAEVAEARGNHKAALAAFRTGFDTLQPRRSRP